MLQIIFTVLIDALSTVGKNGQQILAAILKQIKANSKLLTEFATSGRVESALINHIQVSRCPAHALSYHLALMPNYDMPPAAVAGSEKADAG